MRDRSNAIAQGLQPSVLIGLVGQGISQSRSPALHEAEAQALGIAYVYRLLDLDMLGLDIGHLPDILAWAVRMGFDGLNITHPAKQAIIPLLDEIDDDAAGIGAVNTVRIREGRTKGFNTDCSGFAEGFRRGLPDASLERVVQVGAGGAGAATARAILKLGAKQLTLVDVDVGRAEMLAAKLRTAFPEAIILSNDNSAGPLANASGLIHATPTGMAAHPGLPVAADSIRPDMWVAEIVYFPLETELLRVARAKGCAVVNGGGMAVFQAAAAMEIFTGQSVDPDRMLRHFAAMGA